MDIRMYQPGDEIAIVRLFELVFKRPYSIEQWQWRFTLNPAGNYKIAMMWDGDVMAGHYAVSPVDMLLDGQPMKTALSLTTMTHPDYGGRGIFKQLASFLYDHLEQKEGYELIWGFPNTNSHYGFIKNLGWHDISAVHTMAVDPSNVRSANAIEMLRVDTFTPEMAALLRNAAANRVAVVRDQAYLNWRIFNKPASHYDVWVAGSTVEPEAVIITKAYLVNEDTIDLNIIDWGCRDLNQFSAYLTSIVRQKRNHSTQIRRITLWGNLWQTQTYGALERIGFTPQAPITYLAGRASTPLANNALDMRNWHLSFIDSDVY